MALPNEPGDLVILGKHVLPADLFARLSLTNGVADLRTMHGAFGSGAERRMFGVNVGPMDAEVWSKI